MKPEEAMEYINSVFDEYFGDRCVSNTNKFAMAQDIAIKALEKQIPTELKKQGYIKVCRCGCEMSTFLMHDRANYCLNCGQALKWE